MRQLLLEDLRFKVCLQKLATSLPPPPVVKAENEVLKDIKLKNILFTVI